MVIFSQLSCKIFPLVLTLRNRNNYNKETFQLNANRPLPDSPGFIVPGMGPGPRTGGKSRGLPGTLYRGEVRAGAGTPFVNKMTDRRTQLKTLPSNNLADML